MIKECNENKRVTLFRTEVAKETGDEGKGSSKEPQMRQVPRHQGTKAARLFQLNVIPFTPFTPYTPYVPYVPRYRPEMTFAIFPYYLLNSFYRVPHSYLNKNSTGF